LTNKDGKRAAASHFIGCEQNRKTAEYGSVLAPVIGPRVARTPWRDDRV